MWLKEPRAEGEMHGWQGVCAKQHVKRVQARTRWHSRRSTVKARAGGSQTTCPYQQAKQQLPCHCHQTRPCRYITYIGTTSQIQKLPFASAQALVTDTRGSLRAIGRSGKQHCWYRVPKMRKVLATAAAKPALGLHSRWPRICKSGRC